MIVRTRIVNLLLLAVLALSGSWLWSSLREPPPALPPAPPVPSVAPPAGRGEPEAVEPGPQEAAARAEGYDVIVARDLFSPARGVVPPAATPAAKPAPKPQPAPKLTLAGVVILDGDKTAFLLEGTAENRPRRLREGEAFAGGTLKAIRPDGVTFVFAGKEIVVPLRTPKEGGAPPAPPGRTAEPPVQPPGMPRRMGQPDAGTGIVGQPRPPRQPTPAMIGVPPGEPEEDFGQEEFFDEEGGEEFIDEEGFEDPGDGTGEDLEIPEE